jgi:acetoin:2,6-dichlorophenolindophenol oxidoreductase subunit alpha
MIKGAHANASIDIPSTFPALSNDEKMQMLRTMFRIRTFETNVEQLFLNGEIPGFVHLYIGEEAVGTGVMANLRKDDYITSTHRGHGHVLAKGGDASRAMAELFGKKTGYCKGKGGSMHIADFSVGMLGANGIVGGGFNIAAGAGMSIQIRQADQVAVCFFGDGASNRGTFHEALNWAAVFKLPVVFVNENNQYASTTPAQYGVSVANVSDRAGAYGIPGVSVDGNDVTEVYDAARWCIERARSGEGPSLLEAKTYRIKGHFVGDPEKYRQKSEVKEWMEKHDPIKKYREVLLDAKAGNEKAFAAIEKEEQKHIAQAIEFATTSDYPDPEEAMDDLFSFSPSDVPEVIK